MPDPTDQAGLPTPEPPVPDPIDHAEPPTPEPSGADALQVPEPSVTRYSASQLSRTRDLLTRLYAARRVAYLYPFNHPAVQEAVIELFNVVSAYHAEGVDVELGFFEGEILMGEQLLTEESVLFDQLIRDMMALGVGSLLIRRGATIRELGRGVQVLSEEPASIEQKGGLETVLAHAQLGNILIGALQGLQRVEASEELTEDARESYGSAVSLLREVCRSVDSSRGLSKLPVRGTVRSLVDNVMSNRRAMLQLTGLKNYDEYTSFHSANVAVLAISLGSAISNDYRFLSALGTGALLHDIGKLSLDQQVLNKEGSLTPEEWAHVRRHPVDGAQMVALMPAVDRSAVVTVLEHHMRYDGSGYPEVSPPRRQRLASRIVAVADSFDAMTSRRSYSAARVQDEAVSQLAQSAGTSLDPTLVRLFIQIVGVYPPRSVVRLTSGDVAVVVQPGESDPMRPLVRIVARASGEFIDPVDLELSRVSDVSVAETIDARMLNIDVDSYFE